MSKLMKKKGLRTFLIVVLVIIAFVLFFKLKGSSVSDNSDKYAGVDFDTMSSEYQREGQYSDYVAKRTDTNTPSGSYDIPVAGFVKKETTKNVTVHNDLGPENEKSESVLIPEGESAVYSVNVEEEGYYNLNLEYYPSTGDKDDRGIAIETKVELYNEKTVNTKLHLMVPRVLTSNVSTRMMANQARITREMRFVLPRLRIRHADGFLPILKTQPDMRWIRITSILRRVSIRFA